MGSMGSLNNYCSKSKSNEGLQKISMLILALLPLLSWYKIPFPVGLGYAIILPFSVYSIVTNGFRINVVPATFWIVFTYISYRWMSNNDFSLWTLLPPGGWIFFIFTLALLWGVITFDLHLLKKYMKWVVIISGILFWIQLMFVIFTGSPRFCFVPNLTGQFIYEDFTYADIVAKHLKGSLPSSIFLEKSYLAYYFLSYLILIWFTDKKDSKLLNKEILFVIATLIASRSGTAIVGLSVIIAIKAFMVFWTGNIRKRVMLIVFITPLLGYAVYNYTETEIGQSMLSRTEELSKEGSSGYTRVMAGYAMFESMSPAEKIFGIGDARDRFSKETSDRRSKFYINGIQTILITLGYVGLILYIIFYVGLFKRGSLTSRMSIIVLLIMSLLESNYLNPYMMLLTIIPCADVNQKRVQLKYKSLFRIQK